MATNLTPVVKNDFVDLVETMQQANKRYLTMLLDRDGHFTAHQVRQAEQAVKVARDRVDQWIATYREESKRYGQAFEARKTDEMQGTFKV